MKPSHEQIAKVLVAIGALFDKSLSPDAMELYMRALENYTPEQIRSAASRVVASHKFANFPLPAEFVAAIETPFDAEANAFVAWEKVFAAIKRHSPGHTQWPDLDELTRATLASFGGWTAFYRLWAEKDEHEFSTFTRKDFIKAYITLSANETAAKQLAATMPVALLSAPTKTETPSPVRTGQPVPLDQIIREERLKNPKFFWGHFSDDVDDNAR